MKNSKFLIAFAAVAFICAPIFAASAKVTYVKGKVEVEKNGNWVALSVGDTVDEKQTISTGFQSEARLNLNGSVLAVAALSRVTLETIDTSGAKDKVSLYVNTGAIRSKVNHVEGKPIDYTSRTPVAVASVRGTDYFHYANGRARVVEGAIAVYSAKKSGKPSKKAKKAEDTTEPADATTPANEISDGAPVGAVVVGAKQETKFTANGNPERPVNSAKARAQKAKGYCKTAAQSETETMGGTTKRSEPEAPKKGGLIISITTSD